MPLQDNDQPVKRVCLGKITQAHGVRGLVKLLVFGEDPQLLNGTLYTAETNEKTLTLTLKNSMGKYWLAEVEGVSGRDEAEALRSTELWANQSILPETDNENEFYIHDLVSLSVIDQGGQTIGSITAIENYGAGDLLDIMLTTGKSFLLPFKKEYVPEIDLSEKRVIVSNIEAFLEE